MARLNESFLAVPPPQKTFTPQSRDLNPQTLLPGTAATTKQANPGTDPGNPFGIGTLGDGRKPFR